MNFFALIFLGLGIVAMVSNYSKQRQGANKAGTPSNGTVKTKSIPAEKPKAAGMGGAANPAPVYTPGFVSMEGKAEETRWHDTVMGEEGEDPCHDEMFTAMNTVGSEIKNGNSETAREWAHAVIMAEILKRPSERRWNARGRA